MREISGTIFPGSVVFSAIFMLSFFDEDVARVRRRCHMYLLVSGEAILMSAPGRMKDQVFLMFIQEAQKKGA